MLGHALMAKLLGIHDEHYQGLAEDASERYLKLVDSEAYASKPLYCPKCDSQRIVKQGKECRKDKQPSQRWLCHSCNYQWVTPLKETYDEHI